MANKTTKRIVGKGARGAYCYPQHPAHNLPRNRRRSLSEKAHLRNTQPSAGTNLVPPPRPRLPPVVPCPRRARRRQQTLPLLGVYGKPSPDATVVNPSPPVRLGVVPLRPAGLDVTGVVLLLFFAYYTCKKTKRGIIS